MPQRINYETTEIIFYKFICEQPDIMASYVGHTTNFIARKSAHKTACNNTNSKNHHLNIYQIMRENGGFINWKMVEIERCLCKDDIDARKKEQYWIDNLNSNMNTFRAYSDVEYIQQYQHQYYIDNANKLKEYKKQYIIDNIDKQKQYFKEYHIVNADKKREYDKQYRIDNYSKRLQQNKQYRIDNADKIKLAKQQYRILNADKIKESRIKNSDKYNEQRRKNRLLK